MDIAGMITLHYFLKEKVESAWTECVWLRKAIICGVLCTM